MNKPSPLTAALLTAGGLIASQTVLALQAGDLFSRGGIAQTDAGPTNGDLTADLRQDASSERRPYDGLGDLFTDRLGIELVGSSERMASSLPVNDNPVGDMGDTRFTRKAPAGLDVRRSDGATGQAGVDLAVARGVMLNGVVSYADLSADVRLGGDEIAETKVDSMAIGDGITYRF